MTLAIAISLIAAALAPFVTAIFIHPNLTATQKRLAAGLIAAVLGALVAVATGLITGVPQGIIDWLAWAILSIGIVISLGNGFYNAWKGSVDQLAAKTSGVAYVNDESDPGDVMTTEEILAVPDEV